MFRKAIKITTLSLLATPAFSTFYLGAAIGPEAASFTQRAHVVQPGTFDVIAVNHFAGVGVFGSLFAGYSWIYNKFYLAGELNANLSSLTYNLTNDERIHFNFQKTTFTIKNSEGISLLPGFFLTDNTVLYGRVGYIIGKSYMRVYHLAAEFKAFTPLTSDDSQPQQRFFDILDYIKDRPNQYLDLIELVYFFLIAGFEGQYHLKADGRQVLDNYIEDLYQIIQQNRYNQPHKLFNENPLPKLVKKSYKTALITLCAAVAVVSLALFTSHFLLENKAKSVLFGHTQLALLDN